MSQLSTPDEYEEWLDRLRSTYESIGLTCLHRLGDRNLADQIGAQVVARMLARPQVFRFFGMPYSARIGHLTEDRIAAARDGTLGRSADWLTLVRNLRELPLQQRHVFVLSFVRGHTVDETASKLGITVTDARESRNEVSRRLREIAGHEPDGTEEDQ